MPRRDIDDDRAGRSRREIPATEREEQREGIRRGGRGREDDDSRESRSRGPSRRGVASLDPGEQREIARRGGEASDERGRAHEGSEDEAREYGREGGRIARGRAHPWNEDEAREAGREGGRARWASRDDEGEYCPECGRGGRLGREEPGRRGGRPYEADEGDGVGRRLSREEREGRGAEARRSRSEEDEDEDRVGSRRGTSALVPGEPREIAGRGGRSRR
jgi:hypothetical protein